MKTDTVAVARKLMAGAVGIDSHIDTVQRVMVGQDLSKRHDIGHVDLPRLREGTAAPNSLKFWGQNSGDKSINQLGNAADRSL